MAIIFLLCAAACLAAEVPLSDDFIATHHLYETDQNFLEYTAITGTLPSVSQDGRKLADLFFIAYLAENSPERPLTFVFPGGPGGSCKAEVLCAFGPRRLATPQEGAKRLPPYRLIDNPETLLPWTDLVFVDPVTTGFSKFSEEADEEEKDQFFTAEGDIASLSEFVESFISTFGRWNSPKYLAGISYGTFRSSGIAEYLSHSIAFHGIILLGSALDFATLIGQRNHPLPDGLLIPTFAATAWYHGRLNPESSLAETVDYARRFVYDQYIPYMLQPTRLSPFEQKIFYKNLSELIGLNEDTVRRYLGRFDEALYTTEFMAQERKIIGGLDTRYVGDLSSIQRTRLEEDPSYNDILGVSCAFKKYLQEELQIQRPLEEYASFMERRHWNFWTHDSESWPDIFQRIRRTLIYNPSMKVFSGSGYYDCRTPFAATEFCFDHLDLPPAYHKNLDFRYYEAGHGFIFDLSSLRKLKEDLVNFYEQ